MLAVSDEVHSHIKDASLKSGVKVKSLIEAVITKELNWLNNPVKIANYFKMCDNNRGDE
jgi:hypothetical protein